MLDLALKEPPHNIDLEQAILGAVLADNSAMDRLGTLEPEDFYEPVHAALFAAMREQWGTVRAINTTTLRAIIAEIPSITENLTTTEYISRLILARFDASGDASNTKALADAQRDYAARRKLCTAATYLDQAARSQSVGVLETANIAVSALDDVLAAARTKGPTRVNVGQAFSDVLDSILNDDGSERITSGLLNIDDVTGGWRRKQFAIVAGRPSMGKSTVISSAMLRTAKAGHGVLMFSLEMSANSLAARCLSDLSWSNQRSIPYSLAMSGRLKDHDADIWGGVAANFATLPLVIDDQRGLTMAEVGARARAEAQRMERNGVRLGLVIVDHLGLVKPSGRYAGNKVNEVGEISDALATLAKEQDVAVVALHQLNRGTEGRENKRPTLADLRNSGDLEQDADLVCFAYREAYYLERMKCDAGSTAEMERQAELEACQNTLELMIAKNRNGPTQTVNLFCDMACNVVRDLAR